MYQVILNGKPTPYNVGDKVVDIIPKEEKYQYYVCTINNNLHQLSHVLKEYHDGRCIELLGIDNAEAGKAYEGTLRYIISMAFYNLFPEVKIKFSYNVSRSIYCEVLDKSFKVNHHLDELLAEVQRIIDADMPIEKLKIPAPEALKIYEQYNHFDKTGVLQTRLDKNVKIYKCGNYYNYVYSNMTPSTGYIKNYVIKPYSPGLIIQYPRYELKGAIPNFKEESMYGKTLQQAQKWGHITDNDTILGINSKINDSSITDFIQTCEAKHNNMLADLGQMIKNEMHTVRLICIAGPSSSGKTTFCNRLRIELKSRGINPVMISMDDYYLSRDEICKIQHTDSDHVDLEDVNCLDIKLFNQTLVDLINGDKVTLPKFNFKTGKREEGETIQVPEDTPIMIEGIHALNESITSSIPKHQKFKVYISPQMQINIDNHSPLSTTDLRLIRRMVRDKQFRNSSVQETIKMWPKVRRGEFKWIYPNQEDADYVFNSELTYELCIFKKYALDELKAIPHDAAEYGVARRLIRYLYFFESIDDESSIPCNSIIREFIGGSCFNV